MYVQNYLKTIKNTLNDIKIIYSYILILLCSQYSMDKNSYIKTDDNVIINEKCIKWVKKMDDCLNVCTKSTGCNELNLKFNDTHKICKINNPKSYDKLNKHFE